MLQILCTYCPLGVQWIIKKGIPIDPAQWGKTTSTTHSLANFPYRPAQKDCRSLLPDTSNNKHVKNIEPINERMDKKGKQHVSRSELIKWLGLWVAMAAEPRRGLSLFIGKIHLKKELFLVQLDYSTRFCMSHHRFQDITSALHFAPLKSALKLQKVR